MTTESQEERGSERGSPTWLKAVTLSTAAMNTAITIVAVLTASGRGVDTPLFYTTVTLIGALTAAPIWLTFRQRVWVPFYAEDASEELEEAEEVEEVEEKVEPIIPVNPEQEIVTFPAEEPRQISIKEIFSPSRLLARKIDARTRVLTLAFSGLAAMVAIIVATFVYPTFAFRPFYDNVMVAIFICALVPPSILDVVSRAYLKQIDSRIPDFLRDMAESQRTGLPFTRALMNATRSNYGALTRELRRSMAKMSLGFTFEEALDSFAESAETPLAHRAAVLLKEVGRSGGKMLQVLDSVYEHIREVISLQKERSKQLTPYTIVIYASYGVYIFVVFILFSTFFAQVKNLVNSGAPFGTNISPSVYYIWFYHMSIIEAVFGGLVAGKISAGSSVAGLKHVLVLLLISFVSFTFFIQV